MLTVDSIQEQIRTQILASAWRNKIDAEYVKQCADMDSSKHDLGINSFYGGVMTPTHLRYTQLHKLINRADFEHVCLTESARPDKYMPTEEMIVEYYEERYQL